MIIIHQAENWACGKFGIVTLIHSPAFTDVVGNDGLISMELLWKIQIVELLLG